MNMDPSRSARSGEDEPVAEVLGEPLAEGPLHTAGEAEAAQAAESAEETESDNEPRSDSTQA